MTAIARGDRFGYRSDRVRLGQPRARGQLQRGALVPRGNGRSGPRPRALTLRGLDFARIVRSARPDADLPFVGDQAEPGNALLLDTTVYIDGMQGKAPISSKASWMYAPLTTVSSQPSNLCTPSAASIPRTGNRQRRYPDNVGQSGHAGTPALRTGYRGPRTCRRPGWGSGANAGLASDDRLRALHGCVLFLQAL